MANETLKEQAGIKAAEFVEDGMVVGLGTGSTAFYAIKAIGERVHAGELEISAVVTSKQTEELAKSYGIQILDINDVEKFDLAIDGADEVSKGLDLIKGGGGALTREKIIDYLADKFVVIVDESKLVDMLGDFPVPVEVLKFSWNQSKKSLEDLGASVSLRMAKGNVPFVTDNGEYILDAKFNYINRPDRLEMIINNIPGVLENGIFRSDKITQVLAGAKDGVKVLHK